MRPQQRVILLQFTVNVPGQLADPEQFGNIVIKTVATSSDQSANASSAAQVVRLKDVARIELGSESYTQLARLNGKPTAAIGIFQTPGANALDVANSVRKTVEKMSKKFPPGMEYSIPFDTTILLQNQLKKFIRHCMKRVFWY